MFENITHRKLIKTILMYKEKFGKFPNPNELSLKMKSEDITTSINNILNINVSEYSNEFILEEVEEFIRRNSLWKELDSCVDILKDPQASTKDLGSVKERIGDIESFSLDTDFGQDFEDEEDVYDIYHDNDRILSTGLIGIDNLISGGLHEESITLFLGQTNVGKTLTLCSLATSALMQAKNVLYVTFEDSQKKISKRIISNVVDETAKNLKNLTREQFSKVYDKAKDRLAEHLVVKQFPEGVTNASHLKSLIKDLIRKRGFKPDLLVVDYIGCMTSVRQFGGMKEYQMLEYITGEVRGLSLEFDNMPIISAMQLGREGMGTLDVDLSHMAGSLGPARKADAIFSITQTADMKEMGIYKMELLKSRFDYSSGRCYVSVDIGKQRLTDADNYLESDKSNEDVQKELSQKKDKFVSKVKDQKSGRNRNIISAD